MPRTPVEMSIADIVNLIESTLGKEFPTGTGSKLVNPITGEAPTAYRLVKGVPRESEVLQGRPSKPGAPWEGWSFQNVTKRDLPMYQMEGKSPKTGQWDLISMYDSPYEAYEYLRKTREIGGKPMSWEYSPIGRGTAAVIGSQGLLPQGEIPSQSLPTQQWWDRIREQAVRTHPGGPVVANALFPRSLPEAITQMAPMGPKVPPVAGIARGPWMQAFSGHPITQQYAGYLYDELGPSTMKRLKEVEMVPKSSLERNPFMQTTGLYHPYERKIEVAGKIKEQEKIEALAHEVIHYVEPYLGAEDVGEALLKASEKGANISDKDLSFIIKNWAPHRYSTDKSAKKASEKFSEIMSQMSPKEISYALSGLIEKMNWIEKHKHEFLGKTSREPGKALSKPIRSEEDLPERVNIIDRSKMDEAIAAKVASRTKAEKMVLSRLLRSKKQVEADEFRRLVDEEIAKGTTSR